MSDPFKFLYDLKDPIKSLGGAYKPEGQFEHSKWVAVARLKGEGDGQSVVVSECRMPASFFKLEVLPGKNSVGEDQDGYVVRMGSGSEMGELIGHLAKAVSEGMIGFYPPSANGVVE